MHGALAAAGAQRLADALLLPLRREVGVFRFSTVRLDVRENSMRINHTLAAMFRLRHGGAEPPAADSDEWKRWLLSELGTRARRAVPLCRVASRCGGNAGHLSHHRPHARGGRPRGLRCADSEHDAQRRRYSRRLSAGEGSRAFCRCRRRRALHATHRTAARDHPRPAPRGRHPERIAGRAAGAAQSARSRQGPRGHDRLFRLEQGRRLSHGALGARQGAEQPNPPGRRTSA